MNRTMTRISYFVAVLLLAGVAAAQRDFSAEVYNLDKSDKVAQAKMYFSGDKMRFEPLQKDPRNGGAFIIKLGAQTATVIMDQQHMYMEVPGVMANQRAAYNFFSTGDVENACKDWGEVGNNKGGSCHKVGTDTVNGRSTIKYEGNNANGETTFFWIDPKLRFPVKWQAKNGSGELRNIQEGSQPSSLFEVPAGYSKMDMGGMMRPH